MPPVADFERDESFGEADVQDVFVGLKGDKLHHIGDALVEAPCAFFAAFTLDFAIIGAGHECRRWESNPHSLAGTGF